MTRWLRYSVRTVLGAALLLAIAVAREPLPAALLEHPAPSLEIADRDGNLVRTVRTESGELFVPVRLDQVSRWVVPALLAAEDARFYEHPGIDPLAMVRAFGQLVVHRRIVSGASTITQQLARTVVPRPRTFAGKLREIVRALRIEASLDKSRILEEYLSRVRFGPNLRGIAAASRHYFDKPASALDLAESATLVAIPRGPTLYDPRRSLDAVHRRRDRILKRLLSHGTVDPREIERSLAEPIRLHAGFAEGGVEHLGLGLASGAVPSGLPRGQYRRLETTLDSGLEREVEALVRRAARGVRAFDVTALSVIVLDNRTSEVKAYIGSPDYFDPAGGANDVVRALRQPGSTLKPFVYAAAMQSLGMTAATLLPDVDLTLPTPRGPYTPKNYDGRTHGPVRLREALANSLNVPAVYTAAQVGPARVLELLRAVGFTSLREGAAWYGAALALGDGEVRLSELAAAYATLARGGVYLPVRFVRAGVTSDGRRVEAAAPSPKAVIDSRAVAVLTDILSDDSARAAAFGQGGVLAFPFPAAAKTGTSKGYRDNWTVGFTHEVTVAVWAGNFDGTPMTGSTGVTGAGPLFHDVMLAAMRGVSPAPLVDRTGLVEVSVCALSGELPGPSCKHRVHELFRADRVPSESCAFHVRVPVDPSNGLRAGPSDAFAEARDFEAYPPRFVAWARSAGRPLAPEDVSPRSRPSPRLKASTQVATINRPRDGARFLIDGAGPGLQEIVLSATAGAASSSVEFVLDGRSLGSVRSPYELPWRLAPGHHLLEARLPSGVASRPVAFDVRAPL